MRSRTSNAIEEVFLALRGESREIKGVPLTINRELRIIGQLREECLHKEDEIRETAIRLEREKNVPEWLAVYFAFQMNGFPQVAMIIKRRLSKKERKILNKIDPTQLISPTL